MKQVNWFERKFDFSFQQNIFPSIIERLEGTSIRLEHKISQIPTEYLTVKPDNKWSIKEHIGHLSDLEPLWQNRLDDILANKEFLREVDLTNSKTDLANHNSKNVSELLEEFIKLRKNTLNKLKNLTEEDIYKYGLHPRLKTPMRTMDLFLFVAEHDDHHLSKMTEIVTLLS
ncbi:DinB family protein [Tenacibaculum sp. IB213877]|uniref:DinB family protein n=1 Tax=Tenacibaculum sp. IB213877 TaxID=3097351 RepID=UPI002A5A0C31|nr:DinB family protein [Tenacibaculum sp. IB213877]MDY0779303.1 DinB family protein [Tenacibaculum sp. IB213877]